MLRYREHEDAKAQHYQLHHTSQIAKETKEHIAPPIMFHPPLIETKSRVIQQTLGMKRSRKQRSLDHL